MKTTLLLWLFLVAHADAPGKDSNLKCSQRTEAELGKDVTLDCYCEPRCHVTHEELKWKFNQNTIVLAYIGAYGPVYQDALFKDRAHVTSTERLKDGNFPVTISKIRMSDEGTYTCYVGSKTCSVEFQLKDQGFKLKCPEGPVEAQVGQNVTLNCKSEAPRDLTEEIISWKFNEKIVLDFKDRKMSRYQPEQFKDRVHTVSSWDVSEGKLSVEISSVSENDTGVYTCSVRSLSSMSTCTVKLIVDIKPPNVNPTGNPGAQGGNTTTTTGGSNTGAIIGIVVGVVLVIAVIVVTWLICKNRMIQPTKALSTSQSEAEKDESFTSALCHPIKNKAGTLPVPQNDRENNR